MYRDYYDKNKILPQKTAESDTANLNSEAENKPVKKHLSPNPFDFLSKFAIDDIILLAIIFMLLTDEESDKTLLAVLGFLFISGF